MAFRHFLKKAEWRNDAFRYFPLLSATFRFSAFSRTRLKTPIEALYLTLSMNCFFFQFFGIICLIGGQLTRHGCKYTPMTRSPFLK